MVRGGSVIGDLLQLWRGISSLFISDVAKLNLQGLIDMYELTERLICVGVHKMK